MRSLLALTRLSQRQHHRRHRRGHPPGHGCIRQYVPLSCSPSHRVFSSPASSPPVYIATVLYKNWRALRGSDRPGQIPFSLLVRVAIFSFVCVVGIGCAFVFLSNVSYFAGNIIISLSESELHIHNAMPVF